MSYRMKLKPTQITGVNMIDGETIEQKVRRIMDNNEPITDGAPIIYTDRRDGVEAAYNIRTDRFEVAIDGMDAVSRSYLAKREGAKVIPMENKGLEGTSDNTPAT